jgi:phenylacetate-coenzyme A ligase PaaK-like adenylate-forming protein
MMTVFHNLRDQLTVFDFQIVVEHSDEKDHLTLNVALDKGDASGEMKEIIIQGMFRQFDEWNMRSSGAIPGINFVRKEDLEYNPRTGKLKRVIDLRLKK